MQCIDQLLNPSEKPQRASNLSQMLATGSGGNSSSLTSDALLYVQMLLDKVETYCQAQQAQSSGVNVLHYKDLLRQIKRVKDKQTSVK